MSRRQAGAAEFRGSAAWTPRLEADARKDFFRAADPEAPGVSAGQLKVVGPGQRRREQPYDLYQAAARAGGAPHAASELGPGRRAFHHLPHLAVTVGVVQLRLQR